MKTLRKRTRASNLQCRCGSWVEVVMTRLATVTKGIGVRKVLGVWCGGCKEVKI